MEGMLRDIEENEEADDPASTTLAVDSVEQQVRHDAHDM